MGRIVLAAFVAAALLGADQPKKTLLADDTDKRIQQAFPEAVHSLIKLNWSGRGLLIAADTMTIADDGRVRLSSCFIAQFPKGSDGGTGVRPTTLFSESAYFKFDKPVRRIVEFAEANLIALELSNGVGVTLPK